MSGTTAAGLSLAEMAVRPGRTSACGYVAGPETMGLVGPVDLLAMGCTLGMPERLRSQYGGRQINVLGRYAQILLQARAFGQT